MANHLVMAALFTRPGDQVLIEAPTYPLLVETARYHHGEVHVFARDPDDFAIEPDRIRSAIRGRGRDGIALRRLRLIVITNLHNPSGALADDATLREVHEIADEYGAHILIDEIYLDAVDGARSAFFLGPRFITTNSLTKICGLGGLRCGWILAEEAVAQRIRRLTDLFDVHPPHIAERLSVLALRDLARGTDSAIGAWARDLLSCNSQSLAAFLRSRHDVSAREHSAGTVSFPGLAHGTVEELERAAQSAGTAIVPGRFFGAPERFRIGIGRSTPVVEEGLRRLAVALDTLD
jgi:aspartate/methionine/tyrosine aminotransferase